MDNYSFNPEEPNGKQAPTSAQPFAIGRYPSIVQQNDYLVEVISRSKILKKSNFYKILTAVFGVFLVILLVLLVVFIILYCKSEKDANICTSEECLRSAANLRLSLDYTVDPCDNFYQYTCGRWSNEHPNHGWFPSFSTFSTITERILISTEKFLLADNQVDDPKPVMQARDFYKSCMDYSSLRKLGLTAMFKYVQLVGLPEIPSMFIKTPDELNDFKIDWLKIDTKIKKVFSMDLLLGFTVDFNTFNRSENVMFFGTPGNKCPLPSPLKKASLHSKRAEETEQEFDFETLYKETKLNVIEYVLKTVVDSVQTTEIKDEILDEATDLIYNMSKTIDELISNFTDLEIDYGMPYNIKTYQTKINSQLTDNQFPNFLENYISYMFDETNITIDFDKDLIYMTDGDAAYPLKLLEFVHSTPHSHLELYFWWSTIFAMILNTTPEIAEHINLQTAPFYVGTPIVRSKSLECSVRVNDFMGMAVGYGIANETFNSDTTPKIEEMLMDIKNAFTQHVKSLSWMDRETKAVTLEKAKEMVSFIGYPEWLFEKGALEMYYKGVEIANTTYLDNMMSIIKLYMEGKLENLRVLNSRDWSTDPTTVNAFNSFTDNSINVPMAILTHPVYNLGLEVLNYGAMGTVLGHELTHGFDNSGRKHDKFGNYKQWWTNKTIEAFESKLECFVWQYENITITGTNKHIQGRKTLGENLADNGGLNHAFIAYQNYEKKHGKNCKLPGFENYTNNQLFFLSFASIWCESSTLDDLEDQIEYDEHSPNSIRVLAALQNSEAFAAAYHCPLGSNMNPLQKKCKVW